MPAKNVTFEVEIGVGALNQVTWEKAGLARRRRGVRPESDGVKTPHGGGILGSRC